MNIIRLTTFLLFLSMFQVETAQALTLRYALIVGNNLSVNSAGRAMKPLRFAEREASELRDALVQLSNFDASPKRTVLLTGTSKQELAAAIGRIVEQQAADLKSYPQAKTLFTFFYTGHGEEGQLLLEDGPLSGEQLGAMFKRVDADLSIGIFDACNSGSLDGALSAKGITATPGKNALDTLSDEVLNAEGRVFFVSSAAGQDSYEDSQLGGVFTHFFRQGLSKAPLTGPGVTLDRVWEYARDHTIAHTQRHGRVQTPSRHISRFTSTGDTYFSFPQARDTTLTFSRHLAGDFTLTYDEGRFSMLIHKDAGTPKTLRVHSGRAWLSEQNGPQARQRLTLRPGQPTIISRSLQPLLKGGLGTAHRRLWNKGAAQPNGTAQTRDAESQPASNALRFESTHAATTWRLTLGYGLRVRGPGHLTAPHRLLAGLRLDRRPWNLHLRTGYGTQRKSFESWGYRTHTVLGQLSAGYGIDVSDLRFDLGPTLELSRNFQTFDDHTKRHRFGFDAGVSLTATLPRTGNWHAQLAVQAGLGTAATAADTHTFTVHPWFGLQLNGAWGDTF